MSSQRESPPSNGAGDTRGRAKLGSMKVRIRSCFVIAVLATPWVAAGCRPSPAKESGDVRGAPPACPNADASSSLAAWSERFPIEQGGVITMLAADGESTKSALLRWQTAEGLSSVETSACAGALAVWIPGVDCPAPASIEQGLTQVAPVLLSRCLSPMTADDIARACSEDALSARSCADKIPPMAHACRPKESTRCQRLVELAARYAGTSR